MSENCITSVVSASHCMHGSAEKSDAAPRVRERGRRERRERETGASGVLTAGRRCCGRWGIVQSIACVHSAQGGSGRNSGRSSGVAALTVDSLPHRRPEQVADMAQVQEAPAWQANPSGRPHADEETELDEAGLTKAQVSPLSSTLPRLCASFARAPGTRGGAPWISEALA